QIALPQPLEVPSAAGADGFSLDVDLELTRDEIEAVCAPLVERSLDVCERLLAAHGLGRGRLARIVLVGGPTVMPMVRARGAGRLAARVAGGLDPMTRVAQGAALYAATAGLDGRAARGGSSGGKRVWLQYPAVSSDLSPHVVGRFVGGDPPAALVLARADGG